MAWHHMADARLEVVVCGTFFNEFGSFDGRQQADVSATSQDFKTS